MLNRFPPSFPRFTLACYCGINCFFVLGLFSVRHTLFYVTKCYHQATTISSTSAISRGRCMGAENRDTEGQTSGTRQRPCSSRDLPSGQGDQQITPRRQGDRSPPCVLPIDRSHAPHKQSLLTTSLSGRGDGPHFTGETSEAEVKQFVQRHPEIDKKTGSRICPSLSLGRGQAGQRGDQVQRLKAWPQEEARKLQLPPRNQNRVQELWGGGGGASPEAPETWSRRITNAIFLGKQVWQQGA